MTKKLILCFCLVASEAVVFAQQEDVSMSLRLEAINDTIFISEPLIIRCWLVNNEKSTARIFGRWGVNALIFGGLDFFLSTESDSLTKHDYRLGVNASTFTQYSIAVAPDDSIYWYNLLWLPNFRMSQLGKELRVVLIRGEYGFCTDESYRDARSIISEGESFVVIPGPEAEIGFPQEWMGYAREYFAFGDNMLSTETFKAFLALCEKIAKSDSRLSYYARYIPFTLYGVKSDSLNMMDFINKYPNTPLSEILEFSCDKKRATAKYPRNILAQGPKRAKFKSKRVRK